MNTHRKTATIAGVLYIIGTVAGVLSVVFAGGLLTADDALTRIAADPSQLMLGAFFVLLMGLSLTAMPVFLYPLLRKEDEALALGMVVFRGPLEGTVYILMVVNWLLLGLFSKEVAALGSDEASLQIVGNVLLQASDVMSAILGIVFIIGAMFLYTLFYRTRLIPRWLSVWGLIGGAIYLAVHLLKFFDINFQLETLLEILLLPIFLQEMVMAFWLIIKGFNPEAIKRLDYTE